MTSNEYAIVTFHPHRQFHADGIQREKQYILLITDKFSMYTNDMLIKSELAEDLNAGLILLTTLTRNFQLNMTMNTQDKFNQTTMPAEHLRAKSRNKLLKEEASHSHSLLLPLSHSIHSFTGKASSQAYKICTAR